MIKREHIKQAIEAISHRDAAIGYSLDEMLGMGLINVSPAPDHGGEEENLSFLFQGEKVLVNRVLFFNEGTVPIEQGLLIRYGELLKKQEIQERGPSLNYREATREIHQAGLRLVVVHEINYAVERLRSRLAETQGEGDGAKRAGSTMGLIRFLEGLREDDSFKKEGERRQEILVFYRGAVDRATVASFVLFPLTMDSLMQVADMNVDFFHVRFILTCFRRGQEKNLMACMVDGKIMGLVYLSLKEQFLTRYLEIKYIATLRGRPWLGEGPAPKPIKGVGTFLVGGVWMLWKNEIRGLREIVLDAEVGARGFYESVGFERRGVFGYVLGRPKGYLLGAILGMANQSRKLGEGALADLKKAIGKEIKALRKRPRDRKREGERRVTIASIRECLGQGARPELARAAADGLIKHCKGIPEAKDLLEYATINGSDELKRHVEEHTGSCR